MQALIRLLDRISWTPGALVAWLLIPLIAASSYEVFSRYVLGEPTFWAFEIGYMVMGTHFLIGMAYALHSDAHVRVDLFYARLPYKARALIDAFTYVCLLLPLCVWLTIGFWHKVVAAYASHERSGMSAFNPVIWPYRLVMCAAFALLGLQALVQLIRCYQVLTGALPDKKQ
ncbi:MAG: TRAP transporter small permease subunit [Betaproteobacteria bacterium]|nr:MAG: TRAP transporter small permease subunit [Betaproteobacteria bacterium]